MSKPIIEVSNLSKVYRLGEVGASSLREEFSGFWARLRKQEMVASEKEFWALRDVSFTVQPGEVVGIIGRNGAGKSTLLKILSRITEPTSGRAVLRGRVASLLEVGTGFHPDLSGRDNIFLNGAILGMTRAEIRGKFDEIVAFAEVEKFIDTPVKRYSSGMYVRLAFAVAAHLEPEILIIDEVLAVGDAAFQKKCLGKMSEVAHYGRTVLFVSHNMAAVRSLCQRAHLLVHGKLALSAEAGPVTDAYLADSEAKSGLTFNVAESARDERFATQLKIERVQINRGEGLWHGCPMEITFEFTCFKSVTDVSFGIGFSSLGGTRVLSMDTDIPGARWAFRGGQRGTAVLRIPTLLLEPDVYVIDLGARSGDNFGLDYLPEAGRAAVLPSAETPPVIAMRTSGRGGVRQPGAATVQLN